MCECERDVTSFILARIAISMCICMFMFITKVSDKGLIFTIKQNISRFHVTMDDAVGVQVRQTITYVR